MVGRLPHVESRPGIAIGGAREALRPGCAATCCAGAMTTAVVDNSIAQLFGVWGFGGNEDLSRPVSAEKHQIRSTQAHFVCVLDGEHSSHQQS